MIDHCWIDRTWSCLSPASGSGSLAQWAAMKGNELLLNRQRHQRHKDGLPPFHPQRLFSINWPTLFFASKAPTSRKGSSLELSAAAAGARPTCAGICQADCGSTRRLRADQRSHTFSRLSALPITRPEGPSGKCFGHLFQRRTAFLLEHEFLI
jgi:hypothetical protein